MSEPQTNSNAEENKPEETAALRQPIFPFRGSSYWNAFFLSLSLFSAIPVLAFIIWVLISLLALTIIFLQSIWGFLLLGFIIFVILCSAVPPNSEPNSGNLGCGCGTYIFIWLFIFWDNNDYYQGLCDRMKSSANSCCDNLMHFFDKSGIAYWSWTPIIAMILAGITCFIVLIIMKCLDWRPRWGEIRFICPHENCGHVSSSLAYECPHCGEIIKDLHPSRYGIFYTTCSHCGGSINASWLTGKNEYSKICPDCGESLNYKGFGRIPESVFVVEGAPRSGKTSFLIEALDLWNKRFESLVLFSDSQQEKDVRLMAERIKAGKFCPPTPRLACPEAYLIRCKKAFNSFLAYFYDTGGVSSRVLDAGASEPYYSLANGIILVIDPWAESGILKAFGKSMNQQFSDYKFASQNADAVIGRLCSKLEHINAQSSNLEFDIPICVVVTKCDLIGLNKVIGIDNQFTQSSTRWEKQSKLVEEFLVKHGMYNFVNIVKTRFKKNAFFAVSVVDEGSRYQSSVLNPVLWMTFNVKEP